MNIHLMGRQVLHVSFIFIFFNIFILEHLASLGSFYQDPTGEDYLWLTKLKLHSTQHFPEFLW